jgi:hypothetical protein
MFMFLLLFTLLCSNAFSALHVVYFFQSSLAAFIERTFVVPPFFCHSSTKAKGENDMF